MRHQPKKEGKVKLFQASKENQGKAEGPRERAFKDSMARKSYSSEQLR